MSAFAEPVILYAVLFFRFSYGTIGTAQFSATAEIAKTFLYTVPALALVWYLLLKTANPKIQKPGVPGKKDIIPGLIAVAMIAVAGFAVSWAAVRFGGQAELPHIAAPSGFGPWAALAFSVFALAYLEESFFRFYLISKRQEMGLSGHRAVLVSTLLFALSHAYLGAWGILNAALCGTALAYVFLRSGSLHGVAIAHGFYNMAAYAVAAYGARPA